MNLFDINNLNLELKKLEEQTLNPNFWNDNKNSSQVLSKIKIIKTKVIDYRKTENELTNLKELAQLVELEQEEDMVKDIIKNTKKIQKDIEKLEISTFLSGKYDSNNAIVTIHPGAGRNGISRLGWNVI